MSPGQWLVTLQLGESRMTIAECPYGKTSQREAWAPGVAMASSLAYRKGRMPEGVKTACPRAEAASSNCLVLTRTEGFQMRYSYVASPS